MMVDRHISFEDALVYDLQRRKPSHVMLPVFKQDLYGFKLLLTDDRFMPIPVQVLML